MTYMLSEEEFAALKNKAQADTAAKVNALYDKVEETFKKWGVGAHDCHRPELQHFIESLRKACREALGKS